jgi:hypothetical protein
MGENMFRTLSEHYPFITMCIYSNVEYVGIVQNRDVNVTTIYDFGSINADADRRIFLDLAATWWWESNRSVPINIFLKAEWERFRPCLKTFANKDLEIVHGPVCSLNDISQRRSKRRSITLVRKID